MDDRSGFTRRDLFIDMNGTDTNTETRKTGRTLRWTAVVLFAVVLCPRAQAVEKRAEKGPVKVTVSLAPDEIRVGDTVTFTIEAIAEKGVELIMPEFSEALGRFRIMDYVPSEKVDDRGRTISRQRYTMQMGMSGKRRIPPILVEFVDRRAGHKPAPDDFDAYELLTEPLSFEVRSITPLSADADMAPPLGKLEKLAPPGAAKWPWVIAVIVVITALSPFAWRWWCVRRRLARRKSAYEIAVSKLKALLARGDAESDIDAFFVDLSGIARQYLEDRFELHAPELTTEEFLTLTSASADLTGDQRTMLQSFLRRSDLVKFAKVVPSASDTDDSVSVVRKFLDETRENAPMLEVAQESTSV